MKKILHIAQCNGGVSEYLKMFFKYSDVSKYKNIFIGSYLYKNEVNEFNNIVDNIEFIDMKREISIRDDLRSIIKIYKYIKSVNPDIIYAHSSKAGALARIANIPLRKKCIYNAHGWAFNMRVKKVKKIIYYIIEKILAIKTDLIISISEFEKKSAITKNLCKDNRIKVICNGIDINKYDSLKSNYNEMKHNLNIPEDSYIIGMVGRMSKQKAPDTFVEVANIVKKIVPNAYFIIVGDGEERGIVEEKINDYKLNDSFKLVGWVDNPYEYIEIFDIATLLSRWEGFGLVLAEYMAMKKPIVATNVDAIPELIESDINGYLAEVDNIQMIVDGIIKIKEDRIYREKLIANSYNKVINNYDIKTTVKAHEKVFEELI